MARALISRYEEVPNPPVEGVQQLIVWANYSGSEWPGLTEVHGTVIDINIDVDSNLDIENKALASVRAYALEKNTTIPNNSIIYPAFKKG